MSEIHTIAQASELIAKKKLSPVELTQQCLSRIVEYDRAIHSFLLPTPERAMADARESEWRMMRGELRGRLDGIPIGNKDIIATAGIRTTAHSRLLENYVPKEDATVARNLREAGTVMIGKLATHEFALGGPSFDLPWPPPTNPWRPGHFTGASSTGTGAAVAAGFILGGTGTDTAGSVRHPATFCGLAGIKPTYGRVSCAGILPLSFTLDHVGPLAWTVEDCAILLQSMASHDPSDDGSARCPEEDFSRDIGRDIRGLKIGVIRTFEDDLPSQPHTSAAFESAIDMFRSMGAEIREIRLSPLRDYAACGWIILLVDAFCIHEPWLKSKYNDYGELMRERAALGGLLRSSDYVQAMRRRKVLCEEVTTAFEEVDVMLTPAQPDEAPLIDGVPRWFQLRSPTYTIPFNVTGLPAMSVCNGFGPQGLPLGMQIVGKAFDERTVFRVAHAYERATPWRAKRPSLSKEN